MTAGGMAQKVPMDLMHPGFAAGQQCSDLVVICLPSLKLSQFVQSGSFDLLRLPLCSCSCRPSPQSRSCAPLCYACLVSYVEVVCLVLLALPCSPPHEHCLLFSALPSIAILGWLVSSPPDMHLLCIHMIPLIHCNLLLGFSTADRPLGSKAERGLPAACEAGWRMAKLQ